MKPPFLHIAGRRERGGAAVEMAIVLPILVLLLTGLIWFAQVFLYYSIMQKASYNAARILSTASPVEISTPGNGNTAAPVAQLVQSIINNDTAMMDQIAEKKFVDVQCDFRTCGFNVPATVRVSIQMQMPFPILEGQSMQLTSDVTMRYAGN